MRVRRSDIVTPSAHRIDTAEATRAAFEATAATAATVGLRVGSIGSEPVLVLMSAMKIYFDFRLETR